MTNRKSEPRFDGHSDRITVNGRTLPLESGVLPDDFVDRLDQLKEASGLTWTSFAQAIGVDQKQMLRWRKKGTEPCGGAMLSLLRFARRFPGGVDILSGQDFQMTFWEEET